MLNLHGNPSDEADFDQSLVKVVAGIDGGVAWLSARQWRQSRDAGSNRFHSVDEQTSAWNSGEYWRLWDSRLDAWWT